VAITLDLKPEVEAELMAQAQAAGLSLAQFVSRELEAIAPAAPAQVPLIWIRRDCEAREGSEGAAGGALKPFGKLPR
jgi:hypothetical protein